MDRPYGEVRDVRVDGNVRFRAELRGELLGHGTTLRGVCERIHQAFIASHGPPPFQGYPDFKTDGARALSRIHTTAAVWSGPPLPIRRSALS